MGLDVYVGPLSRYYSFDWETTIQQAGRTRGLDVTVVRGPGWEQPDPQEMLEAVATWRKALGDAIRVPMRWDESLSGDYETDKPDWDGYHAMRYLALHDEFPDLPTPTRIDRHNLGSIEHEPLEHRFGEVYAGRNQSRIGRLLGRKPPEPVAPPRYLHIETPELWLPVTLYSVLSTAGPMGKPMTIGSVSSLLAELERVNDGTIQMDQAALDAALEAGPPEDGAFDPLSRFGLASFLMLARAANARSQPMIMDY